MGFGSSAAAPAVTGAALLLEPLQANVVAAFTNPEILIGTGFYLFLKPLLKASPLEMGKLPWVSCVLATGPRELKESCVQLASRQLRQCSQPVLGSHWAVTYLPVPFTSWQPDGAGTTYGVGTLVPGRVEYSLEG